MKMRKTARDKSRERGVAIVVVIAILAIMAVLAISNSRTLASLKRELQRIEAHQLKRVGAGTNEPPARVAP
jgi:Tfp pilus assembly protein PilX